MRDVRLIGVEAAGEGLDTGQHAATPGTAVRRACCTAIAPTCCRTPTARSRRRISISAGLDYPGVGPEHAWLKDSGPRRSTWASPTTQALQAFHDCCRIEGIIPALESSHALAYAAQLAPQLAADKVLLVNLSGRGDKDLHIVAEAGGMKDMGAARGGPAA